jgi:hypothetical protein
MGKKKKNESTQEVKKETEKVEIPHSQQKGSYFDIIVYPEYGIEKFCVACNKEHIEYAYILHNRSVNEETGEKKKDHWHCLIKMPVGMHCRISAVSRILDIPDNCINTVSHKYINEDLAYYLHLGTDKEKYQPDDLKGNLKELQEWKECFYDTGMKMYTEKEALSMAYNFIYGEGCNSMKDLMAFVIENDIAKQLRPYYYVLGRLINERERSVECNIQSHLINAILEGDKGEKNE